jgi:gliding motility-associated-like protein
LPLVWNGLTFTAAGSQSVTLPSAAGCDSVVTLILLVSDSFADTLAISICEGSNYVLPDGISVAASGTYTSNLQNQFGCDSIITTVLAVDPQITLTLSNDTGICAGTSIDLIVAGATQYSWDPAEGLSSTTGSAVSATPSNTTTYSVTGQSGTCTASDSIVVEVLPLPELAVTPASVTLCSGDSIQLTASGAESYSWSEASLFDCDTCATALLSPINSTTVILEGTLGLCNASIQIPVQVLEWPVAQITADTSICEGDTIALLGSGGINYLWSNGDTSAQSIVSPQSNSIYTLIADNGVCADTSTVEIVVHPLPIAFAGEDTTIRYGRSVQLNATASDNFTWNPLDQLDCTLCLDPVASPPATIEYCLNVTNSFGCTANDCVTITVDTLCADLFIPNVFAPDAAGDEANNCFRIYGGDCITNMNLKIFTRWGELIFETQRTGDCWDGTGKGKELNPGVYIYQFDAGIITGERISKQGNITLIK